MSTITLDSIDELQGVLDGIVDQYEAIPLGDQLAPELAGFEQQHQEYFDRAAGPDGASWPPNAPSTVRRKGHGKVLRDKDDLMQSLTSDHPDAIRHVFDEGNTGGLTFGTSRDYSRYHDRPSGNRPARRHVGTNEQHVDGIAERVADRTVEALMA